MGKGSGVRGTGKGCQYFTGGAACHGLLGVDRPGWRPRFGKWGFEQEVTEGTEDGPGEDAVARFFS